MFPPDQYIRPVERQILDFPAIFILLPDYLDFILEVVMFLKERKSNHMVEVLAPEELFDLFRDEISGRYQQGEEAQEPENFKKSNLVFLSGEKLPRCWTDSHYRDDELLLYSKN